MIITLASGCRVTFDTHYQKIGTGTIHPNVTQYIMEFQIADISDESNPIKIATPRLMVLAGSAAEISIGELKKQFIEIKAIVSKETGEGTAEISIIQNERRASGKLTTLAGQPAKLLTGNFAIQFTFKEVKNDQ
tara:strand:- start:457 stop:858 length:402 start_codon:yes stop_codon:yes gene_type:complete